ncbi:hypothetical protein Acsp02_96720 [Actinoplanes sp. NBRC 103695]|nr:hypothetical protein Acsp02_96720 [Actinoplanes sp. NBRC 103695]
MFGPTATVSKASCARRGLTDKDLGVRPQQGFKPLSPGLADGPDVDRLQGTFEHQNSQLAQIVGVGIQRCRAGVEGRGYPAETHTRAVVGGDLPQRLGHDHLTA